MQEKECKIVRVISQKSLASDVYSLWLDVGEMAKHAKAGQFVSVYSKDGSRMLPRPISICEVAKATKLSVWYTGWSVKEQKNFQNWYQRILLKLWAPSAMVIH